MNDEPYETVYWAFSSLRGRFVGIFSILDRLVGFFIPTRPFCGHFFILDRLAGFFIVIGPFVGIFSIVDRLVGFFIPTRPFCGHFLNRLLGFS
jgi:hypothetical protein